MCFFVALLVEIVIATTEWHTHSEYIQKQKIQEKHNWGDNRRQEKRTPKTEYANGVRYEENTNTGVMAKKKIINRNNGSISTII